MKNQAFIKYARYLAWNAMITGALAVGYCFGVSRFAGYIIGPMYGAMVFSVFAFITASAGNKKYPDIEAKLKDWKWYHVPTEAVFFAAAIYMGYKKIAVLEFAEFVMLSYLRLKLKSNKVAESTINTTADGTKKPETSECAGCPGNGIDCADGCVKPMEGK